MRTKLITFISSALLLYACNKTDSGGSNPNPLPPAVTIPDSTYKINSVSITDINNANVNFSIKPPAGESYSNIFLHWSTNTDFSTDNDSVAISSLVNGQILLKRLQQSKLYHLRISLLYKAVKFTSAISNFTTGTVVFNDYPKVYNRGGYHTFTTNFFESPIHQDTSTRVWLDNYQCTMQIASGGTAAFVVPFNIPTKKYALKYERNGTSTIAPDSVMVAMGYWTEITPPPIPLHPSYPENAVGYINTCRSSTKAYIVPGSYLHALPWNDPNESRPGFIMEFDFASKLWTKRVPAIRRYFENPICYYYNNAIYILGGWNYDQFNSNLGRMQKMLRLDLTTLVWTEMDPFPYPTIFNLVSFEINNEWYIGLGADVNDLNRPSNKFWKYNPATNVWTTMADMPRQHGSVNQNYPTGFSIGNKGYVYYGAVGMGAGGRELWEYNNNVWTKINLPIEGAPPIADKYCIFPYNGKAVFTVGQMLEFFGTAYLNSMKHYYSEYDFVNSKFTRIAMPNNSTMMKCLGVSGNKVYLQADAVGYLDYIHNRTFELRME